MKSPLIGKVKRMRAGVALVGGLRVAVLRVSPIGTLTVKLLDDRKVYRRGDVLHVKQYEVEDVSA